MSDETTKEEIDEEYQEMIDRHFNVIDSIESQYTKAALTVYFSHIQDVAEAACQDNVDVKLVDSKEDLQSFLISFGATIHYTFAKIMSEFDPKPISKINEFLDNKTNEVIKEQNEDTDRKNEDFHLGRLNMLRDMVNYMSELKENKEY